MGNAMRPGIRLALGHHFPARPIKPGAAVFTNPSSSNLVVVLAL